MTIEDILDKSTQNVNLISEDDITKLQQESTNTKIACINPIFVRIDEFAKAPTKIQQQDTSIVLPLVVEAKEKESN